MPHCGTCLSRFFLLGSQCFTGMGHTRDFLVKKCIHLGESTNEKDLSQNAFIKPPEGLIYLCGCVVFA